MSKEDNLIEAIYSLRRALKEKEPEVVARMGYNKGGAVINKPKKPLKEIK